MVKLSKFKTILDSLDEEDVGALKFYLNIQVLYKGFWHGVNEEHALNAFEAWTGGEFAEYHPDVRGGNTVAVHCQTTLHTKEEFINWVLTWLDDEQLALVHKALKNSRRKRRVYLDGELYYLKDELKKKI